MAKRDYGWAIPLPPQSYPNAWSGEDQPPSYEQTMGTQSHLFQVPYQAPAPPAAHPACPPYPAYPGLGHVYPPLPDYPAPGAKSSHRRESFEVQHAMQQDYKAELQTKATAPPLPPPLLPPQRPQQDTIDTALAALSTNSRKADDNLSVHSQQSTQGLRPHRPPPPPPTKAKTLTRQDTFDEYQPAEEPLYINPDEINPKRQPDPVEEPLYIEVLSDTEPHRPHLHHSVSDNPRAPRHSNGPLTPPLPAERQIRHQLSLPARLPVGLQNTHRVSKDELEILLEWWNTAKDTEPLSNHEKDITAITHEAHRVRLALHLYEGLLFCRGQIFNDYITQLYCMADKLDSLHKKTRIAGIAGGTTGAVGGVAAVAGVVLAPLTFGASLAVTAIGVGVAAAGGVTGASVAIKNKMSDTKERKKVEEIVQSYRSQMEDVEACLKFISAGVEGLRKYNPGTVRGMDKDAVRVLRLAQVISSQSFNLRPTGRTSGVLDGFAMNMDIYFSKEDREKLKKGSETKFARNIRELAKQLKGGLDELMQVRDTVRSAVQQVVRQ